MRYLKTLFAVAVVVLLTAAFSLTQMGPQSGGQRGRGMGACLYNTATESTIKGTVEEVQQITPQMRTQGNAASPMFARCPRGWNGTHLSLRTEQGAVIVHVGPATYLENKNFSVAKGDELTITGSKVQYQGNDFLIAKEIKRGDQVLTLRDAKGFPLWSGGGRGGSMGPMCPMANPGGAN